MAKKLTEREKQLLKQYGDNVRPLTKKQIEWCRKDTARYIWFANKDTVNGHCERCDRDVTMKEKTRHNTEVRCPKCKQKLKVRHDWRMKLTDNVDFRVIVKVDKPTEVLLRYVLIDQDGRDRKITEVAREIMDFNKKKVLCLEKEDGKWCASKKQKWFLERNMYEYRRYCCLQGDPYIPGLKAELNKLDCLQYLEDVMRYMTNRAYVGANIRCIIERAPLLEKFEKAGFAEYAKKDFNEYLFTWGYSNLFDLTQTSLVKMMQLNKYNFRRWALYQTREALEYLQTYPNMTDEELKYVITNKVDKYVYKDVAELQVGHTCKVIAYAKDNNIPLFEYLHYVRNLKNLNYKIDKAYLFPKDFRKADDRVSQEWQAKQDVKKLEGMTEQSKAIKKISDGLRNMDDLKEFMNGSDGLFVVVPDSAKDLFDEGRALHNCIGSYVDRIAEKKTFVFFVRKISEPNEPFVSFEYCNGDIIQCRYDYNKAVDDDKIINFVDAVAERLRRNKILCAAA